MDSIIDSIYKGILDGDQQSVAMNVQSALVGGFTPADILRSGLVAAMDEIGRRFEAGEYYVPEMLVAARAMQKGLKVLKPHLVQSGVKMTGKVVIGTVAGDLHDVGKNLVGMMLEGAGFEVIDLGTDVKPEGFIAAVPAHAPDIIGMSALLTTTMPNMLSTLQGLEKAGLRKQVRVMVGGAPVTEDYAAKIGADGFAADASLAVKLALSLKGQA